jgi:hypothetical protein
MITANDIIVAFESSGFRQDLQDMSSYAANIRQERPLVLLFARYFWKQGHKFALEKKKVDLVIDETRIEFKFHFDYDMLRLKKDLSSNDDDIEKMMQAVADKKLSSTWSVGPGVYKDVVIKQPNIFVWILCSRDLRNLTSDDISRVCIGTSQRRYNKNWPYESNNEFLEIAKGYLTKLQKFRSFSIEQANVKVQGSFPSTYHLMLCDFTAPIVIAA